MAGTAALAGVSWRRALALARLPAFGAAAGVGADAGAGGAGITRPLSLPGMVAIAGPVPRRPSSANGWARVSTPGGTATLALSRRLSV